MEHYYLKVERDGTDSELDLGPKLVQMGSDAVCEFVVRHKSLIRPVHLTIQPRYLVKSTYGLYAKGQSTNETWLTDGSSVALDPESQVVLRLLTRESGGQTLLSVGRNSSPRPPIVPSSLEKTDALVISTIPSLAQSGSVDLLHRVLRDVITSARRVPVTLNRSADEQKTLQDKIRSLETQLAAERESRAIDAEKHKILASEHQTLKAGADASRIELEKLRHSAGNSEKDVEIQTLRGEVATLRAELASAAAENSRLKSALETARQEIELRASFVSPEVHNEVLKGRQELTESLRQLNETLAQSRQAVADRENLKAEVNRLEDTRKALEIKVRDQQTLQTAAGREIQNLLQRARDLEAADAKHVHDLDLSRAEVARLTARIGELDSETQILKRRIATFEHDQNPEFQRLLSGLLETSSPTDELETLRRDLAARNSEITSLKSRLQIAESVVTPPQKTPTSAADRRWLRSLSDGLQHFLNDTTDMVGETLRRDVGLQTRRVAPFTHQAVQDFTQILGRCCDGAGDEAAGRLSEWFNGTSRKIRAEINRDLRQWGQRLSVRLGKNLSQKIQTTLAPEVIQKSAASGFTLSSREARNWEAYTREFQKFSAEVDGITEKLAVELCDQQLGAAS